jgi:hypothetical protein
VLSHGLLPERELDVSPYGAEIYDILYLPQLPFPLSEPAAAVRAAERRPYPGNETLLAKLKRLDLLKQDGLSLAAGCPPRGGRLALLPKRQSRE